MGSGWRLVISDLQIPFEDKRALDFCKYLKRHYNVADEDVYNVGDEVDQYWGGLWPKSIEAAHTALQEIKSAQEQLGPWYDAFPKMKLCESNHGSRWKRKATQAEIPSIMLREYKDVLGMPVAWRFAKSWIMEGKQPVLVEHGDDHGGGQPHIQCAMDNGMSCVIGHFHSLFGVEYIRTKGMNVFAAVSGSLIDEEQYAFEYAKRNRKKPQLGSVIVSPDGRMALPIPLL